MKNKIPVVNDFLPDRVFQNDVGLRNVIRGGRGKEKKKKICYIEKKKGETQGKNVTLKLVTMIHSKVDEP